MSKKIAFHSNVLSLRGDTNVIYNYANYNETLLDNVSYVVCLNRIGQFHTHELAKKKMRDRFGDRFYIYNNQHDLAEFYKKNNIDIQYMFKAGLNDGGTFPFLKNCIHAVFQVKEPHGDAYAYISDWLSNKMSNNVIPVVPHIIEQHNNDDNLLEELNIPEGSTILGRIGGHTTFNIPFVIDAVNAIMEERKDLYLILMNTDRVCEDFRDTVLMEHPRIIHLDATLDDSYKNKFINTCDALLHARVNGESFGLSIGEFSVKNKPVITWTGHDIKKYYQHPYDNAHVDILEDNAYYYNDYEEIKEILLTIKPPFEDKKWDMYSKFSPEIVMKQFDKIFIQDNPK